MNSTIVRGRHVLTMTGDDLTDGAVRIVDGIIYDVAPYAELAARHPGDDVSGGAEDIVVPGFVNAHGHFSEALVAGMAEDRTLFEWLDCLIAPIAGHLTRPMAYVGTLLAAVQQLESGITTTNDMFVCDPPDGPVTPEVVTALDEVNLRAVVSFGATDRRGVPVGRLIEEHRALAEAAAASRMTSFRLGIATVGAQSPKLLQGGLDLADELRCGVHLHLHEVREEVIESRRETGLSPIERCAEAGVFEHPTVAAHAVWLSDRDRQILVDADVGVAHNPVSNMILGSGICPVADLRRHGLAVGIGVDGAASNDSQNMLEAIKTTVLLQRAATLSLDADARSAVAMATIEGARALGLESEIGSLERGKRADIVVFDGDSPALANVHDPYQTIVYRASPRDIREVWVGGRRSVADGRVLTVDRADVVRESRGLARELARRSGLSGLSLLC
ncbi:amidohydrolase [Dactylosporangium sp. NPDC050688]|uniref:amidohydrolase family protein n=1 Tax=Dactylosporangium sp. NPDC050688 TaxID=3157217 RepID=UPI0033FD03A8